MNLFRWLAYVLILIAAVLAAALLAMLAEVTGAGSITPEVRRALLVLLLVILVLLLVIVILLCLARAKDRLRRERRLYREAHGEDSKARTRAEAEFERLRKEQQLGLRNICDVLVRRKFPRSCLPLPVKVTRRPDPCIYSQFYLMAAGLSVTWDNPNVDILLGGIPQDTYNLQPATLYQIRVGLENASPFFDSLGTQIQVNLLTFGIGGTTTSAPITSFTKDIPALTSFPGVPETLNWTSPSEPGHYCIQVLISHPDDVNPANNEGWNNTEIRGVQAGELVRRAIPIWNASRFERKRDDEAMKRFSEIALRLDSYELPTGHLPVDNPDALFVPRAAQWNARLTATQLTIPPGTQTPTEVEFEVRVPPDAARGTRATFNVSATAGDRPLGGVTIYLEVR